MIVDTSAIVAIQLGEPDARIFGTALRSVPRSFMSAATYVELINVLDRRIGLVAVEEAEELLASARVEIVPFTREQARWARHARLTYGLARKGGSLNFGDCFAYALAKETGERLLFKGADFALTDIRAAI